MSRHRRSGLRAWMRASREASLPGGDRTARAPPLPPALCARQQPWLLRGARRAVGLQLKAKRDRMQAATCEHVAVSALQPSTLVCTITTTPPEQRWPHLGVCRVQALCQLLVRVRLDGKRCLHGQHLRGDAGWGGTWRVRVSHAHAEAARFDRACCMHSTGTAARWAWAHAGGLGRQRGHQAPHLEQVGEVPKARRDRGPERLRVLLQPLAQRGGGAGDHRGAAGVGAHPGGGVRVARGLRLRTALAAPWRSIRAAARHPQVPAARCGRTGCMPMPLPAVWHMTTCRRPPRAACPPLAMRRAARAREGAAAAQSNAMHAGNRRPPQLSKRLGLVDRHAIGLCELGHLTRGGASGWRLPRCLCGSSGRPGSGNLPLCVQPVISPRSCPPGGPRHSSERGTGGRASWRGGVSMMQVLGRQWCGCNVRMMHAIDRRPTHPVRSHACCFCPAAPS